MPPRVRSAMDFNFKPAPPLVFDQNLHKNYEKFKQRFNLYLTASDLGAQSDERKVAIFLDMAREEANGISTCETGCRGVMSSRY